MNYYSRLQRIKEKKKRSLLYRKIFRVAVVPGVFGLAIFLYLLMVSQTIEKADQKEKATSRFAPDGASWDKKVAGEKTEKSTPTPSLTSTAKPTLTPLPINTPSPTVIATIAPPTNTPAPLPTPTSEVFAIPSYMTTYTGNNTIRINQGTIAFKVLAVWKSGDGGRVLFLGNFNGQDKKNAFEIRGHGNFVTFSTNDKDGNENGFDAPDANLGEDYFGKTFDIVVAWNFITEPGTKRIYVNGRLSMETSADPATFEINPQILTGSIENLRISDKWEDR